MPEVKKWCGEAERCDICQKKPEEVFYDARTRMGPWGLLCQSCFDFYGVGLGQGCGQKYDAKTKIKLDG